MTPEIREKLQRVLGIIDGATYGASQRIQEAMVEAAEILEDLLEQDKRSKEHT